MSSPRTLHSFCALCNLPRARVATCVNRSPPGSMSGIRLRVELRAPPAARLEASRFAPCVGTNVTNSRVFLEKTNVGYYAVLDTEKRACAEVSSSHRYVTANGNIKLSLLSSFTRSSHIRLLNPAASKERFLRLHIKRLSCITVMTAEHSKCFPSDPSCRDVLFYAIGLLRLSFSYRWNGGR